MSEAGRRKTMEVFGKPLAPAEVVEQICADVRTQGLGGGFAVYGQARRRGAYGGNAAGAGE